jgi:hypothetical protein
MLHRARGGLESQITVLAIAHEQPFTLERAADALGDLLNELLQFLRAGAPMRRNTGGFVPLRYAPSRNRSGACGGRRDCSRYRSVH